MIRSPLPYRVLVGVALLGGMSLLWAGSVVHYGQGDSDDPVALLADVHAYTGAGAVKAATDVGSMVCFLLAAVGLAATVRGRGRAFTVGVAVLVALGAPSHILGASFGLSLTKLTAAGLPHEQELRVADELLTLQNIYFIGLIPFLLALVLIPAALWRARIVSWGPFALILFDLVVVGRFTDSTTPASLAWWIDPVITLGAYAWLATGLVRYRTTGPVVTAGPAVTVPAPS